MLCICSIESHLRKAPLFCTCATASDLNPSSFSRLFQLKLVVAVE